MQKILWVFVLLIQFSGVTHAQNKTLNIPAQDLPDALHALSSQTGIQILFTAEQLKGIQSSAINGPISPEQALSHLLQGISYTWTVSGRDTYVIKSVSETATLMPEVKVTGSMGPDTPGNPSYTRTNASTATKSNLPLIKTPISVQVVPRAVMEDQQAVQVEDVIRNVSGVFPGFTFGGFSEEFMIRGFNTNYANYRDGFRTQAARLSLANIERVEVVKGAATNFYGRIEPGGMINLITKRPQTQRYYSLNQQFGSFNQYQTLVDATGALNESGTLLYRLNFEYLNKDSFRDFGFAKRYFVAPSVTWKITSNTQFYLDFMYSNEKSLVDYGHVALDNRPAKIPRSRLLGEPTDISTHELYNTYATLTHAFNDNWQVRARFGHFFRHATDGETFGTSLNEVTGMLERVFYGGPTSPGNEHTYQGTVDVTGRFYTAGIEHNVLAGWEYNGRFGRYRAIYIDANPINIFNPQYNPVTLGGVKENYFFHQNNEWNGVYFQDQITLFDKLHIMGGGRYDWATSDAGSSSISLADAQSAGNKIDNARFSPRAGIVYQPWEWLSFYGNYVQSLGAHNGAFDSSGNILKPQIGEQFEGGFKTSFFDGRLNSNVVYYHLTKQNLAFRVPGQLYSIPIGQARSQGVEVDISGQITQGLNLILTYAYTDTEMLEGNNKGNRLWNVPKHAGSLWARYDVQYEPLRGLSIGAGIYAQGKRLGDPANTYFLPAQARVDAMVRYRPPVLKSRLSLQLNAYNLADSTLYGGTLGDRFSVNVGMPRTFVGSIRYEM